MVKNVLLGFATAALAVASAASSYNVTFYQPVTVNGTQLKPGDYKLELKDNNMAVLKLGETVTEAPVTVKNDSQKHERNTIRLNRSQLEEIRLGGTTVRLVFEKSGRATNSGNATN
jgi:phosphatidate phosphatase PAH1